MSEPIFSIITPTYNGAKVLPRTVKSILKQTFPDFELIIIDDGSSENIEDIIRVFNDNRIIYKKLPQNRGVNTARNYGLDMARGKYINFVDHDDEYLPNALEAFKNLWQDVTDKKIGNVVTMCIDSKTREKMGCLEKDNLVLGYKDIICREKAKGEFRSSWKKEAIGNMRFDEELLFQESILWWRLAKKWDFLYTDISTTIFYKNPSSLSSVGYQINSPHKMVKATEILLNEHGETWIQCCPQRYLLYLNAAVLFNLLTGNKNKAKHWITLSFRQNMFSLKNWALCFLYCMPRNIIVTLIKLRRKIKKEVNY
ncbi:MAG: hypothetical protein A2166_00395 [Omnitrophica WOR_2 bacterium RBG_13_41_10]|nr:MAG: hypothetical protein A2166_00395 [Omnitrophica WOR_2 bacterium RBG_13_41_10]